MAESGYNVVSTIEKLTGLLGGPVPIAVAELPDDVLVRLTAQIETERARQSELIDEAARKAVAGVPFPVRGIVRLALLG
jgi:hypothetical protein